MSESEGAALGYGFGPVDGSEPTSLCLLLHGFGADGSDMIGAAQILADYFPRMAFVAPNAPEPCLTDSNLFQWYDPTGGRELADYAVTQLAPRLNRYIDMQLERLKIAPQSLLILGFSQGGGVAIETALRRSSGCAALLSFTSAVRNKTRLRDFVCCRPPTLLVHGADDPVIPLESFYRSLTALRDIGVNAEQYICADLGHTMNEEGVHAAAIFAARYLGEPT